MSVLYRVAVPRRPDAFSPSRTLECAIFTHPESMAGELAETVATSQVRNAPHLPFNFSVPEHLWPKKQNWRGTLESTLRKAHGDRDLDELAKVARAYLASNDIKGSRDLDSVSSAAVRLFDPLQSRLTASAVNRIFALYSHDQQDIYYTETFWDTLARLCNVVLARQCLGMLGESNFDLIAAIRALCALIVLLSQYDGDCDVNIDAILALIRKVLGCLVVLPHWCVKVDPCDDEDNDPIGPLALSPLERKLEKIRGSATTRDDDEATGCRTELPDAPQDPCCPEIRYYITDLLELRDHTHCYKAGDLAYIEVVAAGEVRERRHKMTRTKEIFFEEEINERASERRDHQVSDRSSLQREISRQIDKSLNVSASASASGDAKFYKWNVSGSAAFNQSSSQATRLAQERARDVVTQAVTEIEKQVRTLRSERSTTEEKEKNIHSFNNKKGTSPKVTKYFYVTLEKKAQLFNYGKRLMAELIVPEPARLYEELIRRRRDAIIDKQLPKPVLQAPARPADMAYTQDSMSPDNYLSRAAEFGIQSPPAPPALTSTVRVTKNRPSKVGQARTLDPISLSIPSGYAGTKMTLWGDVAYRGAAWINCYVRFELVGQVVYEHKSGLSDLTDPLPDIEGNHSIAVRARGIRSFTYTIEIDLELKDSALNSWKASVFQPIKDAYDEQMAEYNTLATADAEKMAEYNKERLKIEQSIIADEQQRHPFYNREIEQAELKRAVIHLLCEDFSKDTTLYAADCGYPEIDRRKAREEGDEWYLWDRMFDWKRFSYAFFDYFWNPMCDWPQKFDPDEPDALFKAFLRAGYARVLVPVNPEMDKDFLWYVCTRQKWGPSGEPPMDAEDPRWRNVVYELKYSNDSALSARTGYVADVSLGDPTLLVKETDLYWDEAANSINDDAVDNDLDRELFIDGEIYRVADIQLDPSSAPYDELNPNTMSWIITLDRPYEGPNSPRRLFAMGAKAVAPAFTFDLPTDLIWAGHEGDCLPCYPLPPCESVREGEERE